MTEIEKLILAVETRGVSETNRQLDSLDKNATKAKGSHLALAVAITAVATASYQVAKALVATTSSYQAQLAALKTSTGSVENAHKAYAALTDLAEQLPVSLEEVTTAFIKLVNQGLDPSEKAIRALENVAASTLGTTLIDVVNATASAVNGEYLALRQFGIRASVDGDKITMSFRGVSETVRNTAKDIEGFVVKIGETAFAGAATDQMETLNGVISNIGDAWARLKVTFTNQGLDKLIGESFKIVINTLDELNKELSSGQLQANLHVIGLIGKDVFGGITLEVSILIQYLKTLGISLDKISANSLLKTPGHIMTGAKIIGNEAMAQVSKAISAAKYIGRDIRDQYQSDTEYQSIKFNNKLSATEKEAQMKLLDEKYRLRANSNDSTLKQESDYWDKSRLLLEDNILAENKTQEDLVEDGLKAAAQLRVDYEKKRAAEAEANAGKDRLAAYGLGKDKTGLSAQEAAKAAAKAAAEAQKQLAFGLASVESGVTGTTGQGLAAENLVIASSYEARKQLILSNTATTEEEKKHLVLQALNDSIMTEQQAIEKDYADRKEFILSSTLATEEEKTALIEKLTKIRDAKIKAIEDATLKARLDAAATFFGNIASIGSTFGEKGFKIAQAAAIAQATIKTYEAATAAYASLAGIPYIGPALGAAAAAAAIVAGAANIAQIKAQTYTKAYASGGMVPAGKYGLVGETGPEIVRGPAVVTSAATTRSKMASSQGSNVIIHNYGQPVSIERQSSGEDLLLILRPLLAENKAQTKRELAQDVAKGGTPITTHLESTYGLRRTGR